MVNKFISKMSLSIMINSSEAMGVPYKKIMFYSMLNITLTTPHLLIQEERKTETTQFIDYLKHPKS